MLVSVEDALTKEYDYIIAGGGVRHRVSGLLVNR